MSRRHAAATASTVAAAVAVVLTGAYVWTGWQAAESFALVAYAVAVLALALCRAHETSPAGSTVRPGTDTRERE